MALMMFGSSIAVGRTRTCFPFPFAGLFLVACIIEVGKVETGYFIFLISSIEFLMPASTLLIFLMWASIVLEYYYWFLANFFSRSIFFRAKSTEQ